MTDPYTYNPEKYTLTLKSWQPPTEADPNAPVGKNIAVPNQKPVSWGGQLAIDPALMEVQAAPISIPYIIDETNELPNDRIWEQISPQSKAAVGISNWITEAGEYGDIRDQHPVLKTPLGQVLYERLTIKGAKEREESIKKEMDAGRPELYAAWFEASFQRSILQNALMSATSLAQIPYWAESYPRILFKGYDINKPVESNVKTIWNWIGIIPSLVGTQMIPALANQIIENPGAGSATLAFMYISHKIGSKTKLGDTIPDEIITESASSQKKWMYSLEGWQQKLTKGIPDELENAIARGKTVTEFLTERQRIYDDIKLLSTPADKSARYAIIAPDWFKRLDRNLNPRRHSPYMLDDAGMAESTTYFEQTRLNNQHMTMGEALSQTNIIEAFTPGKTQFLHDNLQNIENYIKNGDKTNEMGDYVFEVKDAHPVIPGRSEWFIMTIDEYGNIIPRRFASVMDLIEKSDVRSPANIYSVKNVQSKLGNTRMMALTPDQLAVLDRKFGGIGDGTALAKASGSFVKQSVMDKLLGGNGDGTEIRAALNRIKNDPMERANIDRLLKGNGDGTKVAELEQIMHEDTMLHNIEEKSTLAIVSQDNLANFFENWKKGYERLNNHNVKMERLNKLPETNPGEIAFKKKLIDTENLLFNGLPKDTFLSKLSFKIRKLYDLIFKTPFADQISFIKEEAPQWLKDTHGFAKSPNKLEYLSRTFIKSILYDPVVALRKYKNEIRVIGKGSWQYENVAKTYFGEKLTFRGWAEDILGIRKSIESSRYNYAKISTLDTTGNTWFGQMAAKIEADHNAFYKPSLTNIAPPLPGSYYFFSTLDYLFGVRKIRPNEGILTSWLARPINLPTWGGLSIVNTLGRKNTAIVMMTGNNVNRQRWLDTRDIPATYSSIIKLSLQNNQYQTSSFIDWLNKLGFPTPSNTGRSDAKPGTLQYKNNEYIYRNWRNAFNAKMYPVFNAQTDEEIANLFATIQQTSTTIQDEDGYTIKYGPHITFYDQRWSVEKGVTSSSVYNDYETSVNATIAADTARQAEIAKIQNIPLSQRTIDFSYSESKGIKKSDIFYEVGRLGVGRRIGGKVIRIIDGDTIEVALDNGETTKIRILGVDTPETHLMKNNPSRFAGQSKTFLYHQALDAKQYTTTALQGKRVEVELDAANNGMDNYGRILAYVYYGPNYEFDITQNLIENGYARVSPYEVAKTAQYKLAEESARKQLLGVWQSASKPIDEITTPEQNAAIFLQALDFATTYIIRDMEVRIKNPGVV